MAKWNDGHLLRLPSEVLGMARFRLSSIGSRLKPGLKYSRTVSAEECPTGARGELKENDRPKSCPQTPKPQEDSEQLQKAAPRKKLSFREPEILHKTEENDASTFVFDVEDISFEEDSDAEQESEDELQNEALRIVRSISEAFQNRTGDIIDSSDDITSSQQESPEEENKSEHSWIDETRMLKVFNKNQTEICVPLYQIDVNRDVMLRGIDITIGNCTSNAYVDILDQCSNTRTDALDWLKLPHRITSYPIVLERIIQPKTSNEETLDFRNKNMFSVCRWINTNHENKQNALYIEDKYNTCSLFKLLDILLDYQDAINNLSDYIKFYEDVLYKILYDIRFTIESNDLVSIHLQYWWDSNRCHIYEAHLKTILYLYNDLWNDLCFLKSYLREFVKTDVFQGQANNVLLNTSDDIFKTEGSKNLN